MTRRVVDHMPDCRLKGICLGPISPGAEGIQQPGYLPRIVNRRAVDEAIIGCGSRAIGGTKRNVVS